MRRDAGLSQVGNELGRVEALVGTQRQPPGRAGGVAVDHVQCGAPFRVTVGLRQVALHDQAGAVLHQSMADEAEHGAGAGGFLVKARIGVGGRGMGGIGPLLASEIDFGIAVLAAVAGHRRGLGLGGLVWFFDGNVGSDWLPGSSSGGVSSTLGWKLFIEAQGFTKVPSTEKWSSDSSGATSR